MKNIKKVENELYIFFKFELERIYFYVTRQVY